MGEQQQMQIPDELLCLANKYRIIQSIGEGAFSTVYKALDLENGTQVAIKAITRTSAPNRVIEELKILKLLEGQNYCIPLLNVIRNDDQIVAVFPLINGIDFKDFIRTASLRDIKLYMYCLLSAVNHMHLKGIIHRDIKPSNFLYDIKSEMGFLIDFGLAQYEKNMKKEVKPKEAPVIFFNSIVKPSKPPGYYEQDTRPQMKAPRAGTRGFRAPEILFKHPYQTKALDMWSVGVVFLSILTNQYPFFMSLEDIDGLVEIATIFGHSEMRKAAKLYGRQWKSNINTVNEERIPFEKLIEQLNPCINIDEDMVDLLNKLLELDSSNRITAQEALKHRYFTK
ncbi:cell cycle protein kinase CDC7 subfam [Nucleospora cyclopteri]